MGQQTFTIQKKDRELHVRISCEIDSHTAIPLRHAIDAAMKEHAPQLLVLDFQGVRFCDSSGVGLILGRSALAERMGCTVTLTGMSPGVCRLLDLVGIERVKNITVV